MANHGVKSSTTQPEQQRLTCRMITKIYNGESKISQQ
jgi:hypothetical protein